MIASATSLPFTDGSPYAFPRASLWGWVFRVCQYVFPSQKARCVMFQSIFIILCQLVFIYVLIQYQSNNEVKEKETSTRRLVVLAFVTPTPLRVRLPTARGPRVSSRIWNAGTSPSSHPGWPEIIRTPKRAAVPPRPLLSGGD